MSSLRLLSVDSSGRQMIRNFFVEGEVTSFT